MSYIGNSPGVASQRVETAFTATSNQTAFTPSSGYTLGYCDVYQNGVKLVNGDDYTASDGVTVTLATGAATGDSIVIVASFPRGLTDGYLKSEADAKYVALTGAQTVAGVKTFSSQIVGIAGTAGAPAVTTTGDTDTGIFFPAANTLAFATNGTEDARFDASGNLILNGTSPSSIATIYPASGSANTLTFRTSGNSGAGALFSYSDGNGPAGGIGYNYSLNSAGSGSRFNNTYAAWGIWLDTRTGSECLRFDYLNTSGTYSERMRIDASGNLLLGSTSTRASAKLDILGNVMTLGANATYYGTIEYSAALGLLSLAAESGGGITFKAGATERARIDSTGNFLLGGTSTSALSGVFGQVIGSTGKTYSGLAYQTATKAYVTFTGPSPYGDSWVIYDTSAVSERFRITSDGYVKANVNGGFYSSTGTYHEFNQPTGATNSAIFRTTAGSPFGPWVYFSGSSPNNTTNYFLAGTDTTNDKVVIYSSGTITNRTGTYNAFSDIKLKQDVIDASSQWSDIKALRFRKFRLKDDVAADPNAPYLLGLIAQEAEQVSPSLIDESPDTERDEEGNMVETGEVTKSVKYSILYMKAVVALQEAMNRIEQLEADVATLKGTP